MHRSQSGTDLRHARVTRLPVVVYGFYGLPNHIFVGLEGEDWTPERPTSSSTEGLRQGTTQETAKPVVTKEESASSGSENPKAV